LCFPLRKRCDQKFPARNPLSLGLQSVGPTFRPGFFARMNTPPIHRQSETPYGRSANSGQLSPPPLPPSSLSNRDCAPRLWTISMLPPNTRPYTASCATSRLGNKDTTLRIMLSTTWGKWAMVVKKMRPNGLLSPRAILRY